VAERLTYASRPRYRRQIRRQKKERGKGERQTASEVDEKNETLPWNKTAKPMKGAQDTFSAYLARQKLS
jgi:hypothetical protein